MNHGNDLIIEVHKELVAESIEQEYYVLRNECEEIAKEEQIRDSTTNAMWIDYRKPPLVVICCFFFNFYTYIYIYIYLHILFF